MAIYVAACSRKLGICGTGLMSFCSLACISSMIIVRTQNWAIAYMVVAERVSFDRIHTPTHSPASHETKHK